MNQQQEPSIQDTNALVIKKKIEDRLKETIGDVKPIKVYEIRLDDIKIEQITPEIKAMISGYTKTQILTLNGCELTNLKNLPEFRHLKRIELSENKLGPRDIKDLFIYKEKLQSITLCDNENFKTFDDIQELTQFQDLFQIDFEGCPISKLENYQPKIFEMFKKLEILDNKNKNNEEFDLEKELKDEEDKANEQMSDSFSSEDGEDKGGSKQIKPN